MRAYRKNTVKNDEYCQNMITWKEEETWLTTQQQLQWKLNSKLLWFPCKVPIHLLEPQISTAMKITHRTNLIRHLWPNEINYWYLLKWLQHWDKFTVILLYFKGHCRQGRRGLREHMVTGNDEHYIKYHVSLQNIMNMQKQ